MLKKPCFGKLARVSKGGDGGGRDVEDGCVELVDLLRGKCVTVLLWVDLGIVEDLVAGSMFS